MSATEPILLAGTLELLILRALIWGARNGYDVARWIKETSDDTIQVEDRALYLALHRLEERGDVSAEWALSENNRRAKYYALTRKGRAQLRAKEATFGRYVEAVYKILGTRAWNAAT
jgi:transcriptional regulator